MNRTLLTVRIFFLLLCVFGSFLIWYANQDWEDYLWICLTMGFLLGTLTILVDLLLKGFSLRGLTAVTFGLGMGALVAYLLASSPLFEQGDPEVLFMMRMVLFVICMYLGTVLALRGKDDFSLVIPYIRFVPHNVDVPVVVVDTSVLIDGRIVGLCQSRFLSAALVVPEFVIEELREIASSTDPVRQARGRKGIEVLKQLKQMKHVDLRIHESSDQEAEEKAQLRIVRIAVSLKAKLMTTDYNLAQLAGVHGVTWLNLSELAKALAREVVVGEQFEVELVREGREPHQAVGYLGDGSMVVVNQAKSLIGQAVQVEVVSVLPSAGGKMVFSRLLSDE